MTGNTSRAPKKSTKKATTKKTANRKALAGAKTGLKKSAAPSLKKARSKKAPVKSAAKKVSGKSDSGAPQLLSGGNPQIPKGDGPAPVQAYLAAMPGFKKDIGVYLDRLVVRTVPGVQKAVRWNTPFYGIKDKGWFLGFHCFNKYVKVTFLRGAALRPLPPGASKLPEVRYLDIHENEQLDEALVVSWIKQAAALPGDPLF